MIPYKLRDFHIELTPLQYQIRYLEYQRIISAQVQNLSSFSFYCRGDPELEKGNEESPQLTDQYRARSQIQIRKELLYNFDNETSTEQGQVDLQEKLLLNGMEDNATIVDQSTPHYGSTIEDTKPLKLKNVPAKIPDDWRSLEIHELATEVESCGVDPVIVREHLIKNNCNVAKKIKSEKKSLVLPRNWRDKIRDELIEDLCSENKLDKGLLDSELQQSEPVSSSPTKLKLPVDWRTMTRETLADKYGIMLERR